MLKVVATCGATNTFNTAHHHPVPSLRLLAMPADSQPFDTGPVHICASGPVEGTGPAGEGAYHIPIQAEAVMTWSRICQVRLSFSLPTHLTLTDTLS